MCPELNTIFQTVANSYCTQYEQPLIDCSNPKLLTVAVCFVIGCVSPKHILMSLAEQTPCDQGYPEIARRE